MEASCEWEWNSAILKAVVLKQLYYLVAFVALVNVPAIQADPVAIVCARCHPREVAAYARTGMARSLFAVKDAPAVPDGVIDHAVSGTKFTVRTTAQGMVQSAQWKGEFSEQPVAFVIGSGNHAVGYLIQMGDHIFQSPLSYYTSRRLWDVAPGYENNPHPDFSRPISLECLLCHSDRPLPVAQTLNRYQPAVFSTLAISCDRCHGSAEQHLKKPVPGSILNPAKLSGAERDSVCEQCHLKGEARILNPGKQLTDFHPGQRTEEVFTTYVAARPDGKEIKVVSHFEQLKRSVCARQSAPGKLWCGTCHNPHDKPAGDVAAYYRQRCLSCHAATLESAHAAPGRDCVGCHMPHQHTADGSHTAFTNHRIARDPSKEEPNDQPASIVAWRQPADISLQRRDLALAFATLGEERHAPDYLGRAYQMLTLLERDFPNDPQMLEKLGMLALTAHRSEEALHFLERVANIEPNSAEAQTNLAAALIRLNRQPEAVQHLQKALALDPLLRAPVNLLARLYQQQGDSAKANELLATYRSAMGIK